MGPCLHHLLWQKRLTYASEESPSLISPKPWLWWQKKSCTHPSSSREQIACISHRSAHHNHQTISSWTLCQRSQMVISNIARSSSSTSCMRGHGRDILTSTNSLPMNFLSKMLRCQALHLELASITGLGRLRHLLTGALGDRHGGSLPVILQLDYTYSASLVCF